MKYSVEEVIQFVNEEDVKFIRLAFCDVFGKQKNISIMPSELKTAFNNGISIDASAIQGFGDEAHSDLFLHPDPSTLAVLPWRPEHGRVVRMFCSVSYPNGKIFECDTRSILIKAVEQSKKMGLSFSFGAELEFYLFKSDELGNKTNIPYDNAGYMDIAPDDKGENIRREICLTLEQMDIHPESSHHEEGPGQNEIDFKYSDPLCTADNTVTFESVVRTISQRNGLWSDFSPKPLESNPGNGFHINISVENKEKENLIPYAIAGILKYIPDMCAFLNASENSYKRFGENKAPKYISWSYENRSQLIRIPACADGKMRVELRSADPSANPYLAFALLLYACMDGIENKLTPQEHTNINMFTASEDILKNFVSLPTSFDEAIDTMQKSEFIKKYIPDNIIKAYSEKQNA